MATQEKQGNRPVKSFRLRGVSVSVAVVAISLLAAGCKAKVSPDLDKIDEETTRCQFEVMRASWGDPSTDSEAELRERERIHDRLSGQVTDLEERLKRVLEGKPGINDLEGAKGVRQKLDRAREQLDAAASKVSDARQNLGKR